MKYFNIEFVCKPNKNGAPTPFVAGKFECLAAKDRKDAITKVLAFGGSDMLVITNVVEL